MSKNEARGLVNHYYLKEEKNKEEEEEKGEGEKSALVEWAKGDNMLQPMPPEAKAELQAEQLSIALDSIDLKTLSDKQLRKFAFSVMSDEKKTGAVYSRQVSKKAKP